MRECTVEQSKLEMYYRECFATWGRDIERLIASVDTPDTGHRDQKAASPQTLAQSAPQTFLSGGSDGASGPQKKGRLSEAEQTFIEQVTRQARGEFEKIESDLVKGELDGLASRLLDDGRVVDPAKAERERSEFTQAMEHERQVFRALEAVKTGRGDFTVARDVTYEFSSVDAQGKPQAASKKETVTVTFRLLGSAEVGRRLLAGRRGSLTVAEDGTLVVVMKRIDGRWHWNPFGW
jgi:hypothetical protein